MATSLLERLEGFKQSDEDRHGFISVRTVSPRESYFADESQDLIEAYNKLESELSVARSDHLDQLNSRRMWQEKAQLAEMRLKESQESAVRYATLDLDTQIPQID